MNALCGDAHLRPGRLVAKPGQLLAQMDQTSVILHQIPELHGLIPAEHIDLRPGAIAVFLSQLGPPEFLPGLHEQISLTGKIDKGRKPVRRKHILIMSGKIGVLPVHGQNQLIP